MLVAVSSFRGMGCCFLIKSWLVKEQVRRCLLSNLSQLSLMTEENSIHHNASDNADNYRHHENYLTALRDPIARHGKALHQRHHQPNGGVGYAVSNRTV